MCLNHMKSIPILFAIILLSGSLAQSAGYEDELHLKAGELFPNIPQKGAHYTIEPTVVTDGFLTRTAVTSKYGEFLAVGPGMLKVRLQEIEALAKLEHFEASEEFKQGAKASAEDKWEALKTIADHPQETLEGIGEGVGRFFKRVARSARTGAQKVDDVLHERVPGSRESEGGGARLPGAPVGNTDAVGKSKYIIAAQASGEVAVNILGFADARRKLAKRLQVDPYTTNKVLSDKLDEVTWSIFAGDLGVDIATSMIPGGTIISSSAMVTNLIWDAPPGDLRVAVEKSLLGTGVPQKDIDGLLRHYYYSLTMQAAVASCLDRMKGVEGRAGIMDLLLTVRGVDQARFAVGTLMMLNRYHNEVQPLRSIEVVGTIIGHTGGGSIVIPTPVDYLSWCPGLDHFSGRKEFRGREVSIFTAGTVTEPASTRLQQRGWKIHQNSKLLSLAKWR